MIGDLIRLIGREQGLDDLNRALRDQVRRLHAPVVGAMHVTCADESEGESIQSFQRYFASDLLPPLKFAQRAPFRLSNLGARYEPGAVAIAEHHFATPESRDAFKVLVVKINAHVAVSGAGDTATYGQMSRYGQPSTACGALHALLAGHTAPFTTDLREALMAGGHDCLKPLLDPAQVAPAHCGLLAAVASARAQGRRAELDIHRHHPHSPTLYLVVTCVTLNRAERDTELLCGIHVADQRREEYTVAYSGLGDDPAAYQVHDEFGRLRLSDEHLPG